MTDASRAIFDTTPLTADSAPGYSAATGFTTGNFGVNDAGTLTVSVKSAGGGATTYLEVNKADLATNDMAGLAAALNAKAGTAGLSTFQASIDGVTKQLSIKAAVGSTIGFGTAATNDPAGKAQAQANSDAAASNTAFGFATGGAVTSFSIATPALADASAVSLLGDTLDSFQDGDTFKIRVVNTSNPSQSREINFQATSAGSVPSSYLGIDGSSAQPYKFNSMQQLAQAISTAFNSSQLSATAAKVVNTGTGSTATQFQLSLNLKADYSMEIEQVTNAAGNVTKNPAGADPSGIPNLKNSSNALESIFGQKTDTAAGGIKTTVGAESLLTTQDLRDNFGKVTAHQLDYGKKITYSRIQAAAAQDGDAKRVSVSASLTRLLGQVAGVVSDSQVSGQPNILNGSALKIQLSEKADRSTSVQLDKAVTTDNLGFAAAADGTGYALLKGLGTDIDVDNALNAFTGAISTIESMTYTLGSQGASIVSWQNFNKDLSTTLTSAATGVVASDTTADSVQLQAMSTRYSLSTSALGLLNQAAQSAVQLLR